ncbi:MAG: hypothetical protein JNL82_40360 [Myxococcales bacterium]|nr:hypothetical protein [Myxococcales bacterium]
MAKYNTKIRYGNKVEAFHTLTLTIEAVPGEAAVVKDGTVILFAKEARGGTVEDAKISFSDGGKRFSGHIRIGAAGPVEYWGWMVGTSESAE